MSRSLRLHDAADIELNEAADFCDLENPGLGDVFLDNLERAFARIREFPDAALAVAPGVRKLVLAKFPFFLIYSVRVDVIRVLAVAHQKSGRTTGAAGARRPDGGFPTIMSISDMSISDLHRDAAGHNQVHGTLAALHDEVVARLRAGRSRSSPTSRGRPAEPPPPGGT
jgi:toxin ParE1/3/4